MFSGGETAIHCGTTHYLKSVFVKIYQDGDSPTPPCSSPGVGGRGAASLFFDNLLDKVLIALHENGQQYKSASS